MSPDTPWLSMLTRALTHTPAYLSFPPPSNSILEPPLSEIFVPHNRRGHSSVAILWQKKLSLI